VLAIFARSKDAFSQMRKHNDNLNNRQLSIYMDSLFVKQCIRVLRDQGNQSVAVLANERCGRWYVQPQLLEDTVYFKSTDGHYGAWDFNLRRLNLQLLDWINRSDCVLIVDSTRKGKRFPDSLSKTIPIWCAVLNRIVHRYIHDRLTGEGDDGAMQHPAVNTADWDMDLHWLPAAVTAQEAEQIRQRLDRFVDRLWQLQSTIDLARMATILQKPLRPLWMSPSSLLAPLPASQLSFLPVVLCSASMRLERGQSSHQSVEWPPVGPVDNEHEHMKRNCSTVSFEYIQGAADDHELWAGAGYTADLFWQSLGFPVADAAGCGDKGDKFAVMHQIGDTGLTIGSQLSRQHYAQFDWVINATDEVDVDDYFVQIPAEMRPPISREPIIMLKEHTGLPFNYCQLFIEEGKRGQHSFARSIPFIRQHFTSQHHCGQVLIHCRQGVDRSVSVGLCILLSRRMVQQPTVPLTKFDVHLVLALIQRHRPVANPSRALLKRLNEHFIQNTTNNNNNNNRQQHLPER
jgi:tRNA A64-2'-O-ribosylphosphate transferase